MVRDMNIAKIEEWFQTSRAGSQLVYYSYERRNGVLLARMCEMSRDIAMVANAARRYASSGRAVIFQKFTPDSCEYIIKKI
jgi:hypothetical protein